MGLRSRCKIRTLWLMLLATTLGGQSSSHGNEVSAQGSISAPSFHGSLRSCLAGYMAETKKSLKSPAQIRQILVDHFKKNQFTPVETLSDAEALASFFGIRMMPDFRALPPENQIKYLNTTFTEFAKSPQVVRDQIALAGKHSDLVLGSIANHPDERGLRGKVVERWKNGETYDYCPGVGGCYTVIAVDKYTELSGSKNTLVTPPQAVKTK